MKQTLLSILLLTVISSAQNYPIQNNYAPRPQDIVVLFDMADREFMPFFFYNIMGDFQDMKMHDSCKTIKVNTQMKPEAVVCVSAQYRETVVGTLSNSGVQIEEFKGYNVNWNGKTTLKQFVNPIGNTLTYSVVVIQ
ncbi:MAG: hypothetical protein J0M15_11760 [Deltaproteobacteria bacterium]|nr:hypothetical protein [Deltaproteobacteria bacterium]